MKKKHTIELIENFISGEMKKNRPQFFNTPNNDYSNGCLWALKKIKEIIDNNKPENFIGKWGYFWDEDNVKSCCYRQLVEIKENELNKEKYEDNFKTRWQFFSLNVPEHCK